MRNHRELAPPAARRWKALAGCALSFGLAAAQSAAAADKDLSGVYEMKGKGVAADDTPYAGTCKLQAHGTYYEVSCLNIAANHTYIGKGMVTGDRFSLVIGDMLSGDHGQLYSGEYLVVYKIAADGSMRGQWVHILSESTGEETLTPK